MFKELKRNNKRVKTYKPYDMTLNSFVYKDNSFMAAFKVRIVSSDKDIVLALTSKNVYTFAYGSILLGADKLKKSIWCTNLKNLIF